MATLVIVVPVVHQALVVFQAIVVTLGILVLAVIQAIAEQVPPGLAAILAIPELQAGLDFPALVVFQVTAVTAEQVHQALVGIPVTPVIVE